MKKHFMKRIVAFICVIAMFFSILPERTMADDDMYDESGLGTTDIMVEYAHLMHEDKKPAFIYQPNFGLPDEVFWQAKLENTMAIKLAQGIWDAANYDTDKLMSATEYYEAVLFDVITYQLTTQEVVSNLTSEVDFNATRTYLDIYHEKASGSPTSEGIDALSNLYSLWNALSPEELEKEVKILKGKYRTIDEATKKSDDIDFNEVIGTCLTVASNVRDLCEKMEQYEQLLQLQQSAVNVLDSMERNVTGKSDDDVCLRKAIHVVKESCKGVSAEALLSLATQVEKDCLEGMVGLCFEGLEEANPKFKAGKYIFDRGIFFIDQVFDASNMFESMRIAYATNRVHEALFSTWRSAESSYGRYQTNAQSAKDYVYTVWMLTASYNVLLDNYSDYIRWGGSKGPAAYSMKMGEKVFKIPLLKNIFGDTLLKKIQKNKTLRNELLNGIEGLKSDSISNVTDYYKSAMLICEENQKKKKSEINSQVQKKQQAASKPEDIEYWSTVKNSLSQVKITKAPKWNPDTAKKLEETIEKNQFKLTSPVFASDYKLSKNMTTYGSVHLTRGNLDLNGHTLTVYGDFYQTQGNLKVNHGKLVVHGNYYLREQDYVDDDGIYYRSAPGYIQMRYKDDTIKIGKDFLFNSSANYFDTGRKKSDARYFYNSGMFYRGMLKIGGDLIVDNLFSVWDSCAIRFFGGHPHTVVNNEPNTRNFMRSLQFEVTGKKKLSDNDNVLHWKGYISNIVLPTDMTLYLDTTKMYGKKKCGVLDGYGRIDLNGHTLTIPGNVLFEDGGIDFNKGTMHIQGALICQQDLGLDNDGKVKYGDSNALFYMINKKDQLKIDGDFIFSLFDDFTKNQNREQWLWDWNVMKAGTIQVGGNMIQKGGRFHPSGKHIVALNGKGKQKIKLLSGAKINILKLSKDISKYKIYPKDAYVTLKK